MARSSPAQRQKLSPAPSWITLGFGLGALTVWALLRQPELPPAPEPVAAAATEAPAPRGNVATLADRPSFNVVAAMFEQNLPWAFWHEGRSQFALWNSVTGDYTDFFEAQRVGDDLFFRPLDRLTWWLIDGYGPEAGVIRFAETNAMRLVRFEQAGILPEARKLPPPPAPQFNYLP